MRHKFKKAMVTGGAGFIGSHLVEELLRQGLVVVSIDDYVTGKRENLKSFLNHPNFQEIHCDVTDEVALRPHFQGVDIVFHEAASKKTICLQDPRRDLEINAKGTFNVLELAKEYKVKKVVHASTGSVYGELVQSPQSEEHPLQPTSYYGVSKLAGDQYSRVFHHMYAMDITVLRYFHVYGPRQEHNDYGGVIPIFCRRTLNNQPLIIFGDGSQQRSFTSIHDVVKANLFVALNESTAGQVYNCASGIKVTIQELAEHVLRHFHKEDLGIKYAEWTPGDIKVFDVDNAKLKALGFKFGTHFKEGLAETLDWYASHLKRETACV